MSIVFKIPITPLPTWRQITFGKLGQSTDLPKRFSPQIILLILGMGNQPIKPDFPTFNGKMGCFLVKSPSFLRHGTWEMPGMSNPRPMTSVVTSSWISPFRKPCSASGAAKRGTVPWISMVNHWLKLGKSLICNDILVGGFNHLEKYSQWEGLSHILWKIKKCLKQPTNIIYIYISLHHI